MYVGLHGPWLCPAHDPWLCPAHARQLHHCCRYLLALSVRAVCLHAATCSVVFCSLQPITAPVSLIHTSTAVQSVGEHRGGSPSRSHGAPAASHIAHASSWDPAASMELQSHRRAGQDRVHLRKHRPVPLRGARGRVNATSRAVECLSACPANDRAIDLGTCAACRCKVERALRALPSSLPRTRTCIP